MPGPGSVACPKPEPRARTKRRKDRYEDAVARKVRDLVSDRDGYCRLARTAYDASLRTLVGGCSGPSEWAHLLRRSKTRGMPAEDRHSSETSVMLCNRHHQGPAGYDGHAFDVRPLTGRGADGPLRYVRRDGEFYDEPMIDS